MQKLTLDEFVRRASEINPHVANGDIEICGEYSGLNKRIKYICKQCNTIHEPIALSVLKGHGCWLCGQEQSGKSQRKTHDEFVIALKSVHDGVTPLDTYITANTAMDFRCNIGHVWASMPSNVLSGRGCPYCSGKRVLVGYNDMWTTRPDIAKMLVNNEDGYVYTKCSNARVDWRCPSCGFIQNRKISSVEHRGLRCERCGDGISYPNKFARALFDQLQTDVCTTEYKPVWGKPYSYDIYFVFNGVEYIVEMDGKQHFEEVQLFDLSGNVQQEVDKIKDELARSNNVNLIRIDCMQSDCDYIKNNILNSKLNEIFDLSLIDWRRCDQYAQSSMVKYACDLWASGIRSFQDLSNMMQVGNSTVRDYIRRGAKFGWCDYDSKHWVRSRCYNVRAVYLETNCEYSFNSLKECSDGLVSVCGHRIAEETIRKYCNRAKQYAGFLFFHDTTTQN